MSTTCSTTAEDARGGPLQVSSSAAKNCLGYVVAIWQDERKRNKHATALPPVVPVVVHHDDRGFTAPTSVRPLVALDGLPRQVVRALMPLQPDFRFLLDDLALASEHDLEARTMSAMAQLSLLFLQHVRHRSPSEALAAIPRWAAMLSKVPATPGGRGRLFALWSYFLSVTEVRSDRLHRAVVEVLGRDAGDSVMNTADKLIERGRRVGRAEGKAEGRVEGRAEGELAGRVELLLRQLEARFGAPARAADDRVRRASSPEVDRWALRLLDAKCLDDVFDER